MYTSPGKKGDCTITMDDGDFMDMVTGKLNPQKVTQPHSVATHGGERVV